MFDPWVRKIPWRRKWQPIPAFRSGNSMDRGAWWAIAHDVAKSQAQLSDQARTRTSWIWGAGPGRARIGFLSHLGWNMLYPQRGKSKEDFPGYRWACCSEAWSASRTGAPGR